MRCSISVPWQAKETFTTQYSQETIHNKRKKHLLSAFVLRNNSKRKKTCSNSERYQRKHNDIFNYITIFQCWRTHARNVHTIWYNVTQVCGHTYQDRKTNTCIAWKTHFMMAEELDARSEVNSITGTTQNHHCYQRHQHDRAEIQKRNMQALHRASCIIQSFGTRQRCCFIV